MISKLTSIIMAIISIVSSIGLQLPAKATVYYDVAYGYHTRQVMDVCFPENQEKKIGAILFIHGGGWVSGDKKSYLSNAKKAAQKVGCISATMNYRYASKSIDCDDILSDIDAALKKIKSMAETRGMKCDRVMLVGTSAGAHLAMLYSYTKKLIAPIRPVAVVSYSGPSDLTDEKFINNNSIGNADRMRTLLSYLTGEVITASNFKSKKSLILEYSPINYVSSACVPTLVVHGAKDTVVSIESARRFVNKLKSKSVKYRYFELPNSGHSLSLDKDVFNKSQTVYWEYAEKYVG